MTLICLVALIGLPGAGKTSLSNWLLVHQASLMDWNVIHLCYDDYFVEQALAIDKDRGYKQQRDFIFKLLCQLMDKLRTGNAQLPAKVRLAATSISSSNYLIVCDDNHYYRSMRYKLYKLCRSQGCIYAQIYLASALNACLLANATRGSAAVPEAVILQMKARLEAPSADGDASNAWERNTLTLTQADFDSRSFTICEFIKSLLQQKLKVALPLAHVKEPQLQSISHQLDLLLRGRIQAQMQLSKQTYQVSKQMQSQALNQKRKQILALFRLNMNGKQTNNDDAQLDYYVNLLK